MHVQDLFSYPEASQKKKGQSYLLFVHALNLLLSKDSKDILVC